MTQSEPGRGAAAKRRRRSRWDVDGKACLTQTSRHGDAGDDYFGAPSAESAGDASGGEKSFGERVNQTSFARFASGFAHFSSLSTSQQAASAYDHDSKATPMASPADAAALATTASKTIATMPSLFTPSSTTPGSPLTSLNDAVCKRLYVRWQPVLPHDGTRCSRTLHPLRRHCMPGENVPRGVIHTTKHVFSPFFVSL